MPREHVFELVVEVESGHARTVVRAARQLMQNCERVTCLVQGHRRLVLCAEHDEDLDRPVAILREAFGTMLRVSRVAVRMRVGRAGLEMPFLGVRVRCPRPHLEAVRRDLQRRDASIVEASAERGYAVVRATAPAASLVGYARQLVQITAGTGMHATWLSHYQAWNSSASF